MELETKTLLLNDDEIKPDFVKNMEMFGWKLQSLKTINKLGPYEFTGTEDYQRKCSGYYDNKLLYYTEYTFYRDTSVKQYNQIVKLEKEFFTILENSSFHETPILRVRKISKLVIGLFFFTGFLAFTPLINDLINSQFSFESNQTVGLTFVSLFFLIIALIFTLINAVKNKKANRAYQLAQRQCELRNIVVKKNQIRLPMIREEVKELMEQNE